MAEEAMVDDPVVAMIVGFVVGVAVISVLMGIVVRRVRNRDADRLATLDASVIELREELTADRETNRRLRHQLAQADADPLPAVGELDAERARVHQERDDALDQLRMTQEDLAHVTTRLAEREAKLREYRSALQEIRLSLEASDRVRFGVVTEDVPPATGLSAAE